VGGIIDTLNSGGHKKDYA